jgi:ubiquinone/menaquinone biosynthesis C-methylase UbiE
LINAEHEKEVEKMKENIKNYWETRVPQTWYSSKEPTTREWFNEIECERYKTYYEYVPKIAEFEHHFNENVLEIGVGVGTDLVQYGKNGSNVYGIDLTENAVRITQKNLVLHRIYSGDIKVADAENMPYEDNMFDLVYSFGVLHHTPNIEKAIEEIYRVLKPESKAIIMLYAIGWKHIIKRMIIQGIVKGDLFKYGYQKTINKNTEVNGNSPLTRVYTRRMIEKLFAKYGEVEITRHRLGEYFDYAPYKTKKLPKFIVNLFYFLTLEKLMGENWIIKAKKTDHKKSFSFWKTWSKP